MATTNQSTSQHHQSEDPRIRTERRRIGEPNAQHEYAADRDQEVRKLPPPGPSNFIVRTPYPFRLPRSDDKKSP